MSGHFWCGAASAPGMQNAGLLEDDVERLEVPPALAVLPPPEVVPLEVLLSHATHDPTNVAAATTTKESDLGTRSLAERFILGRGYHSMRLVLPPPDSVVPVERA